MIRLFCFREMNALYVIACLLLGVSIAAEIVAKQWYADAMQTVARAATASPEVREETMQNADVCVRAGDRASMSGLIGAGVGVLLWVLSRVKGNRWTPVLPALLVVARAMMWLVTV